MEPESREQTGVETKLVIYEAVVKRFELEIDRTDGLDSKAANLAGFVGVVLGVVTGFGSLYLKIPGGMKFDWDALIPLSPIISFALALILLFLSFVESLVGLQIRKFVYVPNSFNLIHNYEDSKQEVVLSALYDEYAVAIKENRDVNNNKARRIQKALWILFGALVALSIHAALVLATKGG